MELNAYTSRVPLRRARSRRFPPSLPSRRRQQPSWRLIGAAVVPLAVLGVVALFARRRLFQGVALLAKAVEEVADTIEDAAEDLAEAAEAKAKSDGSGE
jgi:heme exporter protein D